MNVRSLIVVPAALLALVAACDAGVGTGSTTVQRGVSANGLVTIDDVGYGGTTLLDNGARVILPEFIVLANDTDKSLSIAEWCLTDSEGTWYGDGLVTFPKNARVPARGFLVVANYPPVTVWESSQGYRQISFEEAYGYAPDYEVHGWQPSVPDLEHAKGRVRLKAGEPVWLIDGDDTTPEELLWQLEHGTLDPDRLADTFPRDERM